MAQDFSRLEPSRIVVANDDAARRLARSLTISTVCADEILTAMVRDGVLTPRQAFNAHQAMTSAGLDPGDVRRSPNDFR